MEKSQQQQIVLHVIAAAIIVWILPDFLLIPLIAYLTQESDYARWLLETIKKRFTPNNKRRDSVSLWVNEHYGTLKRMVHSQKKEELLHGQV